LGTPASPHTRIPIHCRVPTPQKNTPAPATLPWIPLVETLPYPRLRPVHHQARLCHPAPIPITTAEHAAEEHAAEEHAATMMLPPESQAGGFCTQLDLPANLLSPSQLSQPLPLPLLQQTWMVVPLAQQQQHWGGAPHGDSLSPDERAVFLNDLLGGSQQQQQVP
jgi:hypothetical protein